MPRNISGEYIWLSGDREAYIYIEGEIRTALEIQAVRSALAASSDIQVGFLNTQTSYLISPAKTFTLFLVRDDKRFALIASRPIVFSGSSLSDRLAEVAEEVRLCGDIMTRALRRADDVAKVNFEKLSWQVSIPY